MARGKLTLAYISSNAERKASYEKRHKGLIKKVQELSTLCDVEACAIIYDNKEKDPEVWPSPEKAQQVLEKFQVLSKEERTKKMVNQEDYSEECINKVQVQLQRLERENKHREMELFMHRVIAGKAVLQDIDMSRATEMNSVINQISWDSTSRIKALEGNDSASG